MMFWIQFLIWAVTAVISELIRPKPNFEDARPATLGDFTFPTATEGRGVPIVWGRIKTAGPNLIWKDNFRKVARIEEVTTGMFSSEDVVIGYRYHVGMQFALCHGPIDSLRAIWINDKLVTTGSHSTTGSFAISQPNLFGGEEHGQGGIDGFAYLYMGSDSEPVNAYLTPYQTPQPAYRGTCHVVWQGGWVGNSTNIAPWAFELERIPDGLNMAAADPGAEHPNDYDANPMNVLYEILTDTLWGLSIPSSDIDVPNFKTAASLLADEGNGFSLFLTGTMEVSDLIEEIQRQIDGSLFFNRAAGQWQVKLARDDYDPGTLDIYDESNIIQLKEYTRQTWEETTNQVRVSFTDRDDEYKSTYAFAEDPANMDLQGQTVQANVNYPGVLNATLANKLAWRDLKALSYPLAKVKFSVNREAWNLAPGSVFKFSWNRLGVAELVFRVGTINYGKVGDSHIEIFAIQDIFAAGVGTYGDPPSSGFDDTPDDAEVVTAANSLILEAPRQLVAQDTYSPSLQPRVWMAGRDPGGGTMRFQTYNRHDTAQPIAGDYTADAQITSFILQGTLDGALDDYGSSAVRPATDYTIDVNEVDLLDALAIDGNESSIDALLTLAYVDGEYIGFEKASDQGGGVWRLERIWRGLFHTAPKAHADVTKIWFIGQGGNLTKVALPSDHDNLDIQLRSVAQDDETTEGETPELEIALDYIHEVPLAPRDPVLNDVYAAASEDIDTLYNTELTPRTGEDAFAMEIAVTARDWRVDSVTGDTALLAAFLDDDPDFVFAFTLDPLGSPIAVDSWTDEDTDAPAGYMIRNNVIRAVGANASIPTTGKVSVTARHTLDSVDKTNPITMDFSFGVTSALQSADDNVWGGFPVNTASAAVVVGFTDWYVIDIRKVLPSSGIVQISINGGGWATYVAAGTYTGIANLTAGDSIRLRFTQAPAYDQFFDIIDLGAKDKGYGVLEA